MFLLHKRTEIKYFAKDILSNAAHKQIAVWVIHFGIISQVDFLIDPSLKSPSIRHQKHYGWSSMLKGNSRAWQYEKWWLVESCSWKQYLIGRIRPVSKADEWLNFVYSIMLGFSYTWSKIHEKFSSPYCSNI